MILRDQTGTRLERNQDKQNYVCVKLTKTLDLLARPTRFELVTLGLEMQGIDHTNDIVLHRFVCLQYLFYNVSTEMA